MITKKIDRICNLQLMTQQQNCQKSAQHRDYSFPAKNHQNKKYVKATNCETNEITYFNSLHAVNQHLGINPGIVEMSAEGLNNCKTRSSKKNNQAYKFEYIQKEDMPDNYLQSANIRPRKYNDEERKIINQKHVKNGSEMNFNVPTVIRFSKMDPNTIKPKFVNELPTYYPRVIEYYSGVNAQQKRKR